MKKYLSFLLAVVCFAVFSGCVPVEDNLPIQSTVPVSTAPTEATTEPPTTETEPPETTAAPAIAEIILHEPTTGPEERFLYGDTTPTWDPDRITAYLADDACSDGELLEKWLTVEGLTLRDLEERDCRQLLLTVACPSDGVATTNVCYERQEDGSWASVPELSRLPGHVGKNGIMHDRVINSYTSPAGLWALGMAFGNAPEPDGLLLPWRDVTPESDWVCDTQSIYFNTWQERDDPILEESWDYEEGEHLADYPRSYAYSCVIEFNTPPDTVPARGCAIFLHCGDSHTAGCVSLPERNLLRVLLWLNPDRNPYILITGHQN